MVTASLVKELREKTGAGMMDCKKVLTETDGDMEKAMELLRERGIAKAAKKSGRVAAEGLVEASISEDGKVGAIVEVNSETDFVAQNAEFKAFVQNVAKQMHAFHRQGLNFIKNQHRIGHRVDMACTACAAAEPSIQELYHRGKYNGLIPVFGQ